ncbi:MAG: GNAT family N-acetyltransferase [Dehalococcoidia bacterium]
MKLTLDRKTKTIEYTERHPSIEVKRLTSRGEMLSYIETNRCHAVTAFAHLDASFPEIARWHAATDGERFALCLIAKGLFPTYIFTMGDAEMLGLLVESIGMPGRAFFTCEAEHLETLRNIYQIEWHLSMKRMMVTEGEFTPVAEKATRLRPAQVAEINALYAQEKASNFTSAQIRRGAFHGIWRDGQLVAVAGTHFIVPTYGIAYLGNVLTHPQYRNQGLATTCVSSVTTELLKTCSEVVLNVEPYNLPAIRTYTGLGYRDKGQVVEGSGHRKSFVSVIISNMCRKFGLLPKYEERMEPDGESA